MMPTPGPMDEDASQSSTPGWRRRMLGPESQRGPAYSDRPSPDADSLQAIVDPVAAPPQLGGLVPVSSATDVTLSDAPTSTQQDIPRRAVVGWVLYDLANTIFSLNVLSLYFSLWVVEDMGAADGVYLIANSFAMLLVFVSAPLIGSLSDQTPRRVPLLMASTIICCVFTFFLGSGGLYLSLACFVVATYFFSASGIFYDALLPTVSTPKNQGKIGGLGVAIGYFGSVIGVVTGLIVLEVFGGEKRTVFQLTAVFFLLFAIPCFVFVRERPRPNAIRFGRESIRRATHELRSTIARARSYKHLPRFLTGHVLYADASNTLIAVMGIYATQEIGFSEFETQIVLMLGIVGAIAGGLSWGRFVDRIGPKRTLMRVLVLWSGLLFAVSMIGFLDLPNPLFWLVAPVAGFALGGTWTADRPLMLRLTPPRYLGQLWGLYAMVGRFAAIIGPLLWTLIVDVLDLGRPAAVLSLLVLVVIAYVVILPIDDRRRDWAIEDRIPEALPA